MKLFCTGKAFLLFFLIAALFASYDVTAQNSRYLLMRSENLSTQYFPLSSAEVLGKKTFSLYHSNVISEPGTAGKFGRINLTSRFDEDIKTWESEKHFWIGAGEIAILEFIPWALAKWIRTWEDPAKNWANVSKDSWWQNISKGFEYDGDNFQTNNFAHPYHGALFFNAGRTNGYNFWESSIWSLTGSAIWEYFGETYRPAFNDWIYTGIGGVNLGEILFRLSSMVTDNTASGSERVWSEIFGTLLNPVRGFNRAISGEMGRNFENPSWSRPEEFLISFDAGTRTLDKDGDEKYTDKEVEGLFTFSLNYGNRLKAKEPFDFFGFNFAIASGLPHFTTLNSSGYLFGYDLEKDKHHFDVNLDFNYDNLIKENISETDTVYGGFLFGATQVYPHILSRFPIGTSTNLVTQVGINGILMGATP
ncbi:MAG: DUF3943 domain-containing protein, partial [Ignavibacteria bacterium]